MKTPWEGIAGLRWVCLVVALLGGVGAPAAFAQDAPKPDDFTNSSGEIAIRCPWFGVGGSVRPGEWAGLQLLLTDSSDKPREVIVRILTTDADGDKPGYEAAITTNPGVNQPVWAYMRMPARFRSTEPVKVNIFAAVEAAGATAGDTSTLGTGRLLASGMILPRQVLSSSEGMIGIVGTRIMGLGRYAGVPGNSHLPAGHERWEVIQRLDPEVLPDRWMGYMQFAAIVWNEPVPSSLNSEKSQALREWVQRGGHLIVVLPTVAQAWTDEANNPLYDITPRVRVNRREGVSLEPLRAIITRRPKESAKPEERLELPANEVLQTFTPLEGATRAEAQCILALPSTGELAAPSEWLVVRRQVGIGMVTFVGLNAASRWMEQRNLPDPELFWHRILGRRGEMVTLKENGELAPGYSSVMRSPVTLDNSIANSIAKTTLAGAGVLMGLAIFVVYWLIAGPIGYAALKKTGNQRHSWVGFVLAAALFTGIAWGGATAIRPAKISAAHMTILDHVYTPEGESVQRARSWMSILIPEYGSATVAVGDPTKAGSARFHNLIAPWEPENASSAGFPDARSYRINGRAPDHYWIPTRSTVKQFQVDWAGGPVWKMPRPVADTKGEPVPITATKSDSGKLSLSGTIIHDLPGTLQDAVIVVNLGELPLNTSFAGVGAWRQTSEVYAGALTPDWAPGTPLNLSTLSGFSRGDAASPGGGWFGTLLSELGGHADNMEGGANDSTNQLAKKMKALAFYGAIEPPDVTNNTGRGSNFTGKPLIKRRNTHGMDLSAWFTQPCIIIVGHVEKTVDDEEAPSPVPLMVGSGSSYKPVTTTGRTFVRWVFPLPARPPQFKESEPETDPSEQSKPEDPPT